MHTSSAIVALAPLMLGIALAPEPAAAQRIDDIRVGDLPGTDGTWQFGEVTVNAPADVVQRWFADVSMWQRRFPDVTTARVLGTTADGRRIVHFSSTIIGRPLTLRLRDRPGLIVYDGEGKDVRTQGKIYIERLDDRRTHVLLQSSSQVHGAAGIFASKNMRRQRAQRKFRSDLAAIVRLSSQRAAALSRSGG